MHNILCRFERILHDWLPADCQQQDYLRLSPNTRAYHRTKMPSKFLAGLADLIAEGFHRTPAETHDRLERGQFHFVVAVTLQDESPIAACLVYFRDHITNPYLFISSLCTTSNFRGKGLAHQLVHAVHTLGLHLNPTPPRGLQMALTVDQHQPDFERIRQIYADCGLADDKTTRFPEVSGTLLGMSRPIHSDRLYEDTQIAILRPTEAIGKRMYCAFPLKHLDDVQRLGIAPIAYADLCSADQFLSSDITFTDQPPNEPCGVFVVLVQPTEVKQFSLRIHVPPQFARCIHHSD